MGLAMNGKQSQERVEQSNHAVTSGIHNTLSVVKPLNRFASFCEQAVRRVQDSHGCSVPIPLGPRCERKFGCKAMLLILLRWVLFRCGSVRLWGGTVTVGNVFPSLLGSNFPPALWVRCIQRVVGSLSKSMWQGKYPSNSDCLKNYE